MRESKLSRKSHRNSCHELNYYFFSLGFCCCRAGNFFFDLISEICKFRRIYAPEIILFVCAYLLVASAAFCSLSLTPLNLLAQPLSKMETFRAFINNFIKRNETNLWLRNVSTFKSLLRLDPSEWNWERLKRQKAKAARINFFFLPTLISDSIAFQRFDWKTFSGFFFHRHDEWRK